MIDRVFFHNALPGTYIAYLTAAGFIQPPIKRLQDAFVRINQTIVVADRLFDLIESDKRVPQTSNPLPFPQDWSHIEFRDVSFTYGTEAVLKNVNFTIKRGEVVALVGESGSGKSTLVNLLERFFDPTSGHILIDDVPINQLDLKDLRKHIALVTQDVFLFRDTIAGNIHAGDFSKEESGVIAAAKLANAHSFISATDNGYENQVGERGGLLSGGEKQRVSIARAIFKDAPILILDEATSALDSVSEMEVQKGLNKLMEGRTAFVIAHRLSTIFNANRIIVMRKGEVVEQGTHEALIAKQGEYHNFFKLQMDQGERARQSSL
jgi:ATP-binding cassette subfamily B protein/subfamily B ATP-binding cassette protein MsbA